MRIGKRKKKKKSIKSTSDPQGLKNSLLDRREVVVLPVCQSIATHSHCIGILDCPGRILWVRTATVDSPHPTIIQSSEDIKPFYRVWVKHS